MYRAAIITASDKGAAGQREDLSGPAIRELLEATGEYTVTRSAVLPDERGELADTMALWCDQGVADVIFTTGGTGFSPRDWTPEATADVCQRMVPGIPEAMRARSMQITPRAMLSRGTAGIRERTLIINLPGSPKAVRESLSFLLPALGHGLEILTGAGGECARL